MLAKYAEVDDHCDSRHGCSSRHDGWNLCSPGISKAPVGSDGCARKQGCPLHRERMVGIGGVLCRIIDGVTPEAGTVQDFSSETCVTTERCRSSHRAGDLSPMPIPREKAKQTSPTSPEVYHSHSIRTTAKSHRPQIGLDPFVSWMSLGTRKNENNNSMLEYLERSSLVIYEFYFSWSPSSDDVSLQ